MSRREIGLFFEVVGNVVEAAVGVEFVGLGAGKLGALKISPVRLVVAEDPVARGAFFALELREKADAIDGVVFA